MGLFLVPGDAWGIDRPAAAPATTSAQLEADWLLQAQRRFGGSLARSSPVTAAEDAAGGCDGVITGKWGFHTEHENDPWWRVDLGSVHTLDRLVVHNRGDAFGERAAHLRVALAEEAQSFTLVYGHDGTSWGESRQGPLEIPLLGHRARYVQLDLPGRVYFHLDEVEVYAMGTDTNVALHRPATQSSVSPWSARHGPATPNIDWPRVLPETIDRATKLAAHLHGAGAPVEGPRSQIEAVRLRIADWTATTDATDWREAYFEVRRATRTMALANPLLDFDRVLFVKRAPTMFPHLSDQHYGWWARPGGGLWLLEGLKAARPTVRHLTEGWPAGNLQGLDISHDARRALFAYSRHEPGLADHPNKRDKQNVPEPVFYHLFEMDLESGSHRQLTRGKYDDFDGRYLPNDEVLFLSTRKGAFLQSSQANAARTLTGDLPDSYVRCGGDDYRPVPVFTLHTIGLDGFRLRPISAFETFEYTPSVADNGLVLYCRWDYIDRFNGHFFSLWSTRPDGAQAQLVYGNYTVAPQATLEPRSIPGSNKILFTAAAHHSTTGGSLALLDPTVGQEGEPPLTRLTPEVPFPETESNVDSFYANPWPLSEDFYLVSWSGQPLPPHGRYEDDRNPVNAQAIYLCDRFGNLDLLHRDPEISSVTPVPIRPRPRPPAISSPVDWEGEQVGSVIVQDVGLGLPPEFRGTVKRLRIIGVVPKVQPVMNSPALGVSREETGKFVLGTVPVETDGSAYFRVPSGLPVFFQALDERGSTLQTMRSLTYAQPGQVLSCVGCHEARHSAPGATSPLALRRAPSKLRPDPQGSWPLRFDQLVQPLLNDRCVACHRPDGPDASAARLDLTPAKAWQSLMDYAEEDLARLVFERDRSIAGETPSRQSHLLRHLEQPKGCGAPPLAPAEFERLALWMDTYGHTQGAFSERQEVELIELRKQFSHLLEL